LDGVFGGLAIVAAGAGRGAVGGGGPATRADATACEAPVAAATASRGAWATLGAGIGMIAWHLGHFPRLPACSSLTFSGCWH